MSTSTRRAPLATMVRKPAPRATRSRLVDARPFAATVTGVPPGAGLHDLRSTPVLPPVQRSSSTQSKPERVAESARPELGPLPGGVRASMEHAFGTDLSHVRVYEGPEAAAIGARAYTLGSNIHFAPGQYRPFSSAGRRLLGHELTHVAQQARGLAKGTHRVGEVSIDDSPSLERDADEQGERAARGERVGPIRAASETNHVALNQGAEAPDGRPSLSLLELAGVVPSVTHGTATASAVQRARLLDFADPSRSDHDPSRLTDAQIQATNEYRSFMDASLVWQRSDHVTAAEALLACRLIVRTLRAGGRVNWGSEARRFMVQAREQLGTVRAEEAMANRLNWQPQNTANTGTEFGRWLLSGGPEPDPSTGGMNCWEVVMFNAYRSGFTTRARMTTLYTDWVAEAGRSSPDAADTAFENAVRRGPEQTYTIGDRDSPRPVAGDLVIFRVLGNHVAVATGRYPAGEVEIMSLWTQNSRHVFRTTIENLRSAGSPIRFFSPSW